MSALRDPITYTLDRVAERVGDPADRVYARLFAANPAYEPMFDMDTDGGVRANMMYTSLMCVIGMAEGAETPRYLLEAAHIHHEGYGLSQHDMAQMFTAMRDEFRHILADDWTDALERAWADLLTQLAQLGATD